MGDVEVFEIGTEHELCESEMEDGSHVLEEEEYTEDESYVLEEEEEFTEDQSDRLESEEESAKNEIQIVQSKAKMGKKDMRRYGCHLCGLIRSKRRRIKEHIIALHAVEIDTATEVDKLIVKQNVEEVEMHESEAKKERDARRYSCELCGFTRSERKLVNAHVISEHSGEVGLKGETDNFVAKRGSKPKDIRRYCCQICGLVRAKRKLLKVHLSSSHGVEIDAKDEIDEMIEKKNPEEYKILESEVKKRKKDENNGFKARDLRRYCCKLCGLIRSKRELLKNHIKSEHGKELCSEDEVNKFIAKKGSEDDRRHYSCQICGFVRSKRRILKLHINSSHGPEAMNEDERFASEGVGRRSQSDCGLCGMSFRKPSHLQQHKLSHSALRSYVCPIDGCLRSYKRQDHLNRHLLKHEGELFLCPKEDCKLQLSTLSNLKRHLKWHRERGGSLQSQDVKSKETKKHCCPETYCEKAFKYPSKLAKHLDDVHSTTYTEVICCEPGCLKYFTNAEALKEHLRQNHNRVCCEICGGQQLKNQIKRHMRIHENQTCVKSIACPYERCLHSYTRKSNLKQHINSVHLGLKPFKCHFGDCGMTYAHKCARDRHEQSGAHCYVQGDFVEEDAAFQSRPRGGRKRKTFTIDSIFRKRVAGPDQSTVLENGLSFMDWLISNNGE